MISYWRSVRATRRAKRLYELAAIESLMAANQRRLDELAEPDECLLCKDKKTAGRDDMRGECDLDTNA